MKKSKGFTLVELIIVIIVVGILALVSVPIYRGHVERAVAAEGKALVVEIAAAQEIYKTRTQSWYTADPDASTGYVVEDLGIDPRKNSYFRSFKYDMGDTTFKKFTVETSGEAGTKAEGMTIVLTWYDDAPSVVTLNGKQI